MLGAHLLAVLAAGCGEEHPAMEESAASVATPDAGGTRAPAEPTEVSEPVPDLSRPCIGEAETCGDARGTRPSGTEPGPRCPASEPSLGDPCELGAGELCSYGESRSAACRA